MSDDITPQPATFDEWWRSVFGNTPISDDNDEGIAADQAWHARDAHVAALTARVRELEADLARRTLRWSTEPPTVPPSEEVDYWVKEPGELPLIVSLRRWGTNANYVRDNNSCRVEHYPTGTRWAGPITPPEEPAL